VVDDINNRIGRRAEERKTGRDKRGGVENGMRQLEPDNYDQYNVSTDKYHSDVQFLVQAKVQRSAN
jgi:hypothetical protein